MLDIYIKQGFCFKNFEDILHYMKDENLNEIEITKIQYVFEDIVGKGIYTIKEIEKIVKEVKHGK